MELTTTSRKRAAELDQALSTRLVPKQADGVAREIAVVTALRELGTATAPAPTDEFRAALRTRLMAVAAVQGIGATATAPPPVPAAVSWRQRLAAVAAGLTAGAVAVTGVSAAASMSLPGDPLYRVKRAAEDVQLRLADGAAEQGRRHAQFAAERLRELDELTAGGSLSSEELADAVELLDDMDAETRNAQRLLTAAFRDTRDTAPVEELADFARDQRAGLSALMDDLPQDLQPRAQTSLALLGDVESSADELLFLQDCTTACDPSASAPVLDDLTGTSGVCECPAPAPTPAVAPPPTTTTTTTPAPAPTPSGSTSGADPATPTSPTTSPSPTTTPLVPLPTRELPLPPLPPLPTLDTDDGVDVPLLPGADDLLGLSLDVASPALGPAALVALLGRWW